MQRHPKRYEISKDELAYLKRPVLNDEDRQWFVEMYEKYADSIEQFFHKDKGGQVKCQQK